jgi:hypothetical protein
MWPCPQSLIAQPTWGRHFLASYSCIAAGTILLSKVAAVAVFGWQVQFRAASVVHGDTIVCHTADPTCHIEAITMQPPVRASHHVFLGGTFICECVAMTTSRTDG